ncbi:unnamed protein product [Cyclocybe aegerita]|uniref:Uncharacterized protein n=1 Tax=Cyclocybe aegerita TaxID=1973307 RepID=A0A8S0W097_CYCAE|nr:unnamed protein product [Cyclocybe aegerita]
MRDVGRFFDEDWSSCCAREEEVLTRFGQSVPILVATVSHAVPAPFFAPATTPVPSPSSTLLTPVLLRRAVICLSTLQRELRGHWCDLKERELKLLEGRALDLCANLCHANFITDSHNEAKELASHPIAYINTFGSMWSPIIRYLSCVNTLGVCDGNVVAYTSFPFIDTNYCDIFFDQAPSTNLCLLDPVASHNIRGGTTLRELTRAFVSTVDDTSGCAADQALSDAKKYRNADNYNSFTTQAYVEDVCIAH